MRMLKSKSFLILSSLLLAGLILGIWKGKADTATSKDKDKNEKIPTYPENDSAALQSSSTQDLVEKEVDEVAARDVSHLLHSIHFLDILLLLLFISIQDTDYVYSTTGWE